MIKKHFIFCGYIKIFKNKKIKRMNRIQNKWIAAIQPSLG